MEKRSGFIRVNVDGTRQLLEVARAAGVSRFIHIGTESAVFRGQHMRDIDESYPYPKRSPFLYSQTKADAEKLVLQANSPGFTALSIRPRLVWGPGDRSVLGTAKKMIDQGRFYWLDGGSAQTSTTHIANLAHAIELALTKGQGGRAYFVTDDETTTVRAFLTDYLATQDYILPEKSLPVGMARLLSFIMEGIWKLFRFRSEPPLTRFAVALTSRDCTIRIDRAKHELEYAPTLSRAEGLQTMPKID